MVSSRSRSLHKFEFFPHFSISALGHARQLKFTSYVHLPARSINTVTISSRLSDLCNDIEVYIFEHWRYISALKRVRM